MDKNPNFSFSITEASELELRKTQYLSSLPAPLDGMWLSFTDAATHYSILLENQIGGFCVINAENKLLQFEVESERHANAIFQQALSKLKVTGAIVATCQPMFQALCVNQSRTSPAEVALMYEVDLNRQIQPVHFPENAKMRLVAPTEVATAIEFGLDAIGCDEHWLTEYYNQRIAGEELFGLWKENELIAVGEYRPSKYQARYADVGMIVSKSDRRKGIATNILRWLIQHASHDGRHAICSTEPKNKAAQKAIYRAGFVGYHKILSYEFST